MPVFPIVPNFPVITDIPDAVISATFWTARKIALFSRFSFLTIMTFLIILIHFFVLSIFRYCSKNWVVTTATVLTIVPIITPPVDAVPIMRILTIITARSCQVPIVTIVPIITRRSDSVPIVSILQIVTILQSVTRAPILTIACICSVCNDYS